MKSFKSGRLLVGALSLATVGAVLVSGTYARYTSNATSGADAARVAKWSFKVNSTDISKSDTFTFNLFNTINDTNGGAAEADVATDDTTPIIAPGTTGTVSVAIKNDSEVNAKYFVDFTEEQTNATPSGENQTAIHIPIQYSLDGTTWVNNIDDLDTTEATGYAIAKDDGQAQSGDDEKTLTLHWRWNYDASATPTPSPLPDQDNDKDTALGVLAQENNKPTVTVTAQVTAVQVD